MDGYAIRIAKSYVMGRKNFLFHATTDGAIASAIVLSLIETAKSNNVNICILCYCICWTTKMSPYALNKEDKRKLLTERLLDLTKQHREHCPEYNRMLELTGFDAEKIQSYEDIPFLPVRLFKELSLKSVPQEEVVKTMTSSGTTGQAVSKIYLDRATSANQQKTMVKIVNEFTGSSRMPMIILDCPSVVKDRTKFSTRGADGMYLYAM